MDSKKKIKNLKMMLIGLKTAMAVGIIMLIINVIGFPASKAATEKCTKAMWGVVIEVERYRAPKNSTKYKAFVTSADAPDRVFESIYTLHEYRKGDRVVIYCDPEDMSAYYIEYAEHEAGDLILIISSSLLLIVMFVLHMFESKKYKKLLSEQEMISE